LIRSSLTPDPSPARDTGGKPQIFVAGEGSSRERGLRPLSYTLPLLNNIENRVKNMNLFERGIKGVSIEKHLNK